MAYKFSKEAAERIGRATIQVERLNLGGVGYTASNSGSAYTGFLAKITGKSGTIYSWQKVKYKDDGGAEGDDD